MTHPLGVSQNGESSLMSSLGSSSDALPIVLGIFLVVNVSAIFFVLFFVPETKGINLVRE